MNKKLFLGMFAAVGMLLATSCQNDELDAVQSGNEATVSFNLGVEGGVQTRAISDGSGANQLVYSVFDAEGKRISSITQVNHSTKFPAKEDITLAKGQTYIVAFWAQNSDCEAYTVSDDMKVSVNYAGANNDENRDAFYAVKEFTVTGHTNIDVTLKRPFAQVNVGVTDADVAAAETSGIVIEKSKAVIKGAGTDIDLLTGEVEGDAEVIYDFATLPAEKLNVDLDGDGTEEAYNYLSMSYILVDKTTLPIEFTFKPNNGNNIVFSEGLNAVPVQSNWRTNILGQILTGNIKFNIMIDPIYDGETDVEVGGEPVVYNVRAGEKLYKTLEDALNAKETNILLNDGEYVLTAVKSNVKISGVSTGAKISITTPGCGGADVTFENVTLAVPNTGYVGVQHVGNMTANNCIIENMIFCYSDPGKKTTFNDCTFNQTDPENYNIWTYGSNVDFNNCTFECAGKSVLIYTEGGDVLETVNFKNCVFNASAPVEGKAAIEIDASLNPVELVNIENCTATGFGKGSNSGNSLYNLKKGELGVNCNITVSYADGGVCLDVVTGVYAISTAEGMTWFADEVNVNKNSFSSKTVVLADDINLAGVNWAPIGQTGVATFNGTFDGNGHTIKNLKINNTDKSAHCATGLFGWSESITVKDVTIDGANIKGHHNVAGIIGYVYGTIENCHVKNATISCVSVNDDANGDKCGAIAGYVGEDARINNCTASNSAIDAGRDAGQVVGAAKSECITSCSATVVTVVSNGSSTGNNINEAIIGRTL